MPRPGTMASTGARTGTARDEHQTRPRRAEEARPRRVSGESRPAPSDGLRPVRGERLEPAVSRARSGAADPGRYTVRISGYGAEGVATRNGTRVSTAQRHSQIKRHERAGFRPDRVAMWAVLLGVTMILIAAASSHAAVLAAHHALALH